MLGKLEIDISKDYMKVYARVTSTLANSTSVEITEAYVKEVLEERGIKAGIIPDRIKELVACDILNRTYVVAEGRFPTKGKAGNYVFYFDRENHKATVREDGTIDYSVQRQLVHEGDLLAEYFPAVQGSFGYTVLATVVAPVPCKELPALKCKGVQKDENKYYALTNGQVTLSDGRIMVTNTLSVPGDCGYGTGDIEFAGDVQIGGDVMSGVNIVVDGNVVVDGVVEGAYIRATGNIVVKKGIHGKEQAIISAGDSVIANFIDQARVSAGNSVVVDSILNSEITAQGTVLAAGKNGLILGGKVCSKTAVEAKCIGNDKSIATSIVLEIREDQDVEELKVVVHDQVYDDVTISIHGVEAPRGLFRRDELHLKDSQMEVCGIGKFEPTPKKKEVVNENKKMVLIVDDEPLILKTFYGFLREKYIVAVVNNAIDAFKFMEQKTPDLILLDYMMPGMDGGEMMKKMRELTWKEYCNTPVYFVTAVVDKSVVAKCLSMYPQGYLVKPLGKEELLDAVDSYFENQK